MRVTSIEYFFGNAEEAFRFAKENRLNGQVRLNLKDGTVCGGAHLASPKPLDKQTAQDLSSNGGGKRHG